MTREDYLKHLIKENGYNIKTFSAHIKVPYTTLHSMFERGVGGAGLDTILKMCHALGISVDSLRDYDIEKPQFHLSDHERDLIIAYRSRPDLQNAVDILLGVEKKEVESGVS